MVSKMAYLWEIIEDKKYQILSCLLDHIVFKPVFNWLFNFLDTI